MLSGYVIVLHSYMQRTLLDPTDKQELEALQQEVYTKKNSLCSFFIA